MSFDINIDDLLSMAKNLKDMPEEDKVNLNSATDKELHFQNEPPLLNNFANLTSQSHHHHDIDHVGNDGERADDDGDDDDDANAEDPSSPESSLDPTSKTQKRMKRLDLKIKMLASKVPHAIIPQRPSPSPSPSPSLSP